MFRAILFDWDGTLLDSATICRRSYERLFASFDIPFDAVRFDATYSPNWYRTYEAVGLARDKWQAADARWLDIYSSEECLLVHGAREALSFLEKNQLPTGVVTSGTRERVRREIARLHLAPCFRTVICSEDVSNKKPHPEALLIALDHLRVEPEHAAYVGDSPEDIDMARAAGVFSVGVPGDFPNRDALRGASPDLHVEDLETAVRVLCELSWSTNGKPNSGIQD